MKHAQSGAIAPLMALAMAVLVGSVGLGFDLGRIYAARTNAQDALDAATLSTTLVAGQTANVALEFQRYFAANYHVGYMNSTLTTLTFAETATGSGVYRGTAQVKVPVYLMRVLGAKDVTLSLVSEAGRGMVSDPNRKKLALTLVLDNSNAMSGANLTAMKNAANSLIDIVYGSNESVAAVNVSIVPFQVAVDIGTNRQSWIQSTFRPFFTRYASARNFDAPDSNHKDTRHHEPTGNDNNLFRVPLDTPVINIATNSYVTILQSQGANNNSIIAYKLNTPTRGAASKCPDFVSGTLQPLQFALTSKSVIKSKISSLATGGCARNHVGLFWGWMTLSEKFQGYWDSARPTLPEKPNKNLERVLVLMTNGNNPVFRGQPPNNITDDNEQFEDMCKAVRNDGVDLYVIGYGSNVPTALLEDCADNGKYYYAPAEATLKSAFESIADKLLAGSVRLTK